jgi:uncharacterized repeat protein (TIGR03803 family)
MRINWNALLGGAVLGALIFLLSAGQNVQAREHKTVYSFCGQTNCTDGANSYASLIDVNGTLYGTTADGGAGGYGAVFSLDPATGAETVLYSFCIKTNCTDGAQPYAGLIDIDGTLYGTTQGGGSGSCFNFLTIGCGTVFSLDPGTGAETVVYSFCSRTNCADGEYPYASLIDVNGTLYGTTGYGGANCPDQFLSGCGTVFSLDPGTGTETVLHSFCNDRPKCPDGAYPFVSLIETHGKLYGTTEEGGIEACGQGYGCGTVFSVDAGTGREKVVYAFCSQTNCVDGARPRAALIDVNGMLFGTTGGGGTGCSGYGCGTMFSFDPQNGTETVLYSFCSLAHCTDGQSPWGSGLIDVHGTLYGTTEYGGASESGLGGTVFSLDPGTGTETVLYSFCSRVHCRDGKYPQAGLLEVNGRLYGTASSGGTTRRPTGGTIFWVRRL